MKVHLMFPDRDFDPEQELPWGSDSLVQDLELEIVFDAMARNDEFLYRVARAAVLSSLVDPELIRYRQEIMEDCIRNPEVVRKIYEIPLRSIENKRRHWMGIFGNTPGSVLSSGAEMMRMFLELLEHLRKIADERSSGFRSRGFGRFFEMIRTELDDDFFAAAREQLRELKFRSGVLLSAELGKGAEGTNYVLRKPGREGGWLKQLVDSTFHECAFSIPQRDNHGARAIAEIRDRGINQVANAVGQSSDHIDNFLEALRSELAFYIGGLNLYERLAEIGEPTAFPEVFPLGVRKRSFSGLYDVSLALSMGQRVVGNDVEADGKDVIVVTGANQGGKSTFLRSLGQAQVMMQCGMFVPAAHFEANVSSGIFTHYRREEDASMVSGKLDEELGRMSRIIDHLKPDALVLLNESFSATNEREGSEIARQVVEALMEEGIQVFFVTHLYAFASSFHEKGLENVLFLRAERLPDGTRTFRMIEGEPLQTSYGKDLYRKIFARRTKGDDG